jgi:hypothetical protein
MSISYKVLSQHVATNLMETAYTVPSNKTSIVQTINICNTSDTPADISISQINEYSYVHIPKYTLFGSGPYNSGYNSSTSTDLITWTLNNIELRPSGTFNPAQGVHQIIPFGNKQVSAEQDFNTYTVGIKTRTVTEEYWTPTTTFSVSSNFNKIKNVNGKVFFFDSSSSNNSINYSTDAVTWTSVTMPVNIPSGNTITRFNDIVYANGQYVLSGIVEYNVLSVNYNSYIYKSTDLVTWTQVQVPGLNFPDESYNSTFAYGNNTYAFMVGSYTWSENGETISRSNTVIRSTDLVTWVINPNNIGVRSSSGLVFFNEKFYMVESTVENQRHIKSTSDFNTFSMSYTNTGLPISIFTLNNKLMFKSVQGYSPGTPTNYFGHSTDGTTWINAYTGLTQPTNSGTSQILGVLTYGLQEDVVNPSIDNKDYLLKDYTLAPNEVVMVKPGPTLSANQKLVVNGSSDIVVTLFGGEI